MALVSRKCSYHSAVRRGSTTPIVSVVTRLDHSGNSCFFWKQFSILMRLFKCLSNGRVIPQNEKAWGVVHARIRGLGSSHTQLNYFVGFCNTTVNFKYNFTIYDFYVPIFCHDLNFIIFINWILELYKLFLKK